jgi:hypothetical protein
VPNPVGDLGQIGVQHLGVEVDEIGHCVYLGQVAAPVQPVVVVVVMRHGSTLRV